MIRDNIRMDVENLTCTGGRRLAVIREELEKWKTMPCSWLMRMHFFHRCPAFV